jgi:hypothetical protein
MKCYKGANEKERGDMKSFTLTALLRDTVMKVQFLDWNSPQRRVGRQEE